MAEQASQWLLQWMKETKLEAYKAEFVSAGVESAEDFRGLENKEEITEFVKEDMGVTKTLKVKKIVKAIQDVKVTLAPKLELVLSNKELNFAQIVAVRRDAEIEKAYQGSKAAVIKSEQRFYNIDVEDVMMKLATCGDLLQFAYANSNGCTCQAKVVLLLSKYHTLTKNSFIGSSKFVDCSISALEYHKMSYDVLPKSPATAIGFLSKCAGLAAAMATVAEQLMNEAGDLVQHAEEALELATQDKTVSIEKRQEAERRIAEAKAMREKLEAQVAALEVQQRRLREDEEKAIKQADKETTMKMVGNIVGGLTSALGNAAGAFLGARGGGGGGMQGDASANQSDQSGASSSSTAEVVAAVAAAVTAAASAATSAQPAPSAGPAAAADSPDDEKKDDNAQAAQAQPAQAQAAPPQAASAHDRAMQLSQQRYEAESEQIKANADLKKTIQELANQKLSKDTIAKALKAIELTIKALGKIKVIFANVRVYWQGVEANCKNLASFGDKVKMYESQPELFQQDILNQIESSALSWFTLLKVNYYGKKAIASVDKKMDSILDNLPDENEALNMVDGMVKALTDNLDSEDAKMAKSMAANKAITQGGAEEFKPLKINRRPKDDKDDD